MIGAKVNIRYLLRDSGGNVFIMTGLFILIIFAVAGAGIDFGRAHLVKTRQQQALDLAALAAANPPMQDPKPKERAAAANLYYNLNFPATYLGVARPKMNYDSDNLFKVSVDGSSSLDTSFIRTVGQDSLNFSLGSKVDIAGKEPRFDVIMVLDASDSMDWRFDGTRCRFDGYPPCNNNDGDPTTASYPYCYDTTGNYYSCGYDSRFWALRVAAGTLNNILLDAKVADKNRVAAITWSDALKEVMNFTNVKNKLPNFLSYYNYVKVSGATDSTKGLQQAKQMSAAFRKDAIRVVVLLTDGENNGGGPSHDKTIDDTSVAICNELKAMDPPTIIYTIALGDIVKRDAGGNFINTGGVAVEQFLRSCASGLVSDNLNKYYFIAPTASQLNTIFTTIATNLQKLRITD